MTSRVDAADRLEDGRVLSLAAIALGALALLSVPWLLGTVGVAVGALAVREGDRLGPAAVAVATVGLFGGLALSYVVFHTLQP